MRKYLRTRATFGIVATKRNHIYTFIAPKNGRKHRPDCFGVVDRVSVTLRDVIREFATAVVAYSEKVRAVRT